MANIAIVPIMAWLRYTRSLSTSLMLTTGALSLVVINLALLFGYRVRTKWSYRARKRLFYVALCLGLFTLASDALRKRFLPTEEDLVELAQSDTPLMSIRPEQNRFVVEFLRRKIANERAYAQTAAAMRPLSPPLYSAQSFADKVACEKTLTNLKTAAEADFRFQSEQEEANKEFRSKMERVGGRSDLTAIGDRVLDPARKVNRLEKEWFSKTVKLYQYAADHQLEIVVRDNSIRISAESVLKQFNDQLTESRDLFQEFQSRVSAVNKQTLKPSN